MNEDQSISSVRAYSIIIGSAVICSIIGSLGILLFSRESQSDAVWRCIVAWCSIVFIFLFVTFFRVMRTMRRVARDDEER